MAKATSFQVARRLSLQAAAKLTFGHAHRGERTLRLIARPTRQSDEQVP
jgi:hypothetical protein